MLKKWLTYKKDYSMLEVFMKELNISETLARILINRNIETLEDAESFLNPSMDELEDPFLMKGMLTAVDRIERAISKGEKICIYGDYDVDGITSVSVLYITLKKLGAEVSYYIPRRLDEGYGLNSEAIEKLISEGIDLIITVDCGIRSIDEVELVNKKGGEIIITDHHECDDDIPNAYSVINPNRNDCLYPFKLLAGVGVAFKLICALSQKLEKYELPLEIIDLAALGTVADVVPLIGENRIIVKTGLNKIKTSPNIGIEALTKVSSIEISNINSYHLSYLLAPRLNAAGRIGDPILGVKLLTSTDKKQAYEIAEELNKTNAIRQKIENEILIKAQKMVDRDINTNEEKIIVLVGEDWHIGVIGIVASRIAEKYNLPAILISVQNNIGIGSARSIPGFDLFAAMNKCSFLFDKFGGHEMAAGITIKQENINTFRRLINEIAREMIECKKLEPEIFIDYKIHSIKAIPQILEEIDMLRPYGEGNPIPVFVFRGLTIKDMRLVGNNKHLSMLLSDGVDTIRGIGFNMGFIINHIAVNEKIDIICNVEKNFWNGTEIIQLKIKDIKKVK